MLQCLSLPCKGGSNCKGTVIDQFTNASLIVKVSYTILLCQYKWTSIFSILLRKYSIYEQVFTFDSKYPTKNQIHTLELY